MTVFLIVIRADDPSTAYFINDDTAVYSAKVNESFKTS